MIDLSYYSIYLDLQKYLKVEMDSYREFCISNMSYNPDDQEDPRNMIRACPECKEIWIKVEGCDGVTTCGNRVTERRKIDSADSNTLRPQTPFFYNFEDDEVQIFERTNNGWMRVMGSTLTSALNDVKESVKK